MDFYSILDQVVDLLRSRQRVTYRTVKRQFDLDDTALEDLKEELFFTHPQIADEDGRGLVWTQDPGPYPAAPAAVSSATAAGTRWEPEPLASIPPHLAEKILASRTALEGERKQVTVLFADLKGSMELLADRDPEEARQLLDPVLERMMAAVHRYEGTVNQVLGDGIMALFGAPIAHEDHAVRACYAALAMQATIRGYAEDVRRTQGLTVQIRIGLNSGAVVVRAIGNDLHMDYTAIGQTTHLAARMEQLASPGTTLLTAGTLRLVEGLVQVTALGPVPVKGLDTPVEIFELVGASALRGRFQARVAGGLTHFVGRDLELAALRRTLARAGAGQGQVVALVGEAGVGKSRLVYEFVHAHSTQGWRVLESASVSYGKATPYFPVIDLLKRYAQVEEHDDPRTIRAKVTGHVLTLDESLHDTLPALLALLEALPHDSPFHTLEPPQRRYRTLTALKQVVLRESQVQPLVLVFEDLHWIDLETQALLDGLVESLPTARLLLLVNYRPEYQHGWENKTYYTHLRLDPLPPGSANALLQALLGDDPSLAPLTQLLTARTEGNPFFLEESVRTLVETGVLVGPPGAYRLAQPLDLFQVPATVQAVLAARIDRLAPEEKRLLQTAAVIGTEVLFPLLQAVAEVPEAALHRGLAHLQTAEFLYETRLFPELEYAFKHALTYQVAYESLLQERRRTLHAQIMAALEALVGLRVTEHVERLAHHALRGEVWDKALAYAWQAAIKAVARSAHAEALSSLTTALELLSTLPETPARAQQELDIQTTLGPVLMALKGFAAPEVEQAYARARVLCQQVGDTPQLFPVLHGLWRFYVNRSVFPTAREIGEELLTSARQHGAPALLVEAHRVLGQTLFWRGEIIASHTHMEQGIVLYDAQQHGAHTQLYGQDPGVVCQAFAAWTLWLLGYPDQAQQRIRASLTLAQERAHPFSLAYAQTCAAIVARFRRDAAVALTWAEAVRALAREQGFPFWWTWGTILRGWALAAQGQEAEGMAQMQEGLAAYQATGAGVFRQGFLMCLAEAQGWGGHAAAGLRVLAEAEEVVHTTGECWWEAELYRLKGELVWGLAEKRCNEAEACFRQALAVARQQQVKSLELRAAMSLSRLWQRQGKREEAYDLLAPVYGWFTEGFDTADLQEAKALLEAVER